MKLNELSEPIASKLKTATGSAYLQRQRRQIQRHPYASRNLMGGNYGARLSPRLKKYFRGSLTGVNI